MVPTDVPWAMDIHGYPHISMGTHIHGPWISMYFMDYMESWDSMDTIGFMACMAVSATPVFLPAQIFDQ